MTRWNNDTLEQRHAGTTTRWIIDSDTEKPPTVVSRKHFGVYIGVPSTRNTLEHGTVEELLWNNDTLERWNNDTLERWNNDTLEQRHTERCNNDTL